MGNKIRKEIELVNDIVEVYEPTEDEKKFIIQKVVIDNLKYDKDGAYLDIKEYDLLVDMLPVVTNLRINTDKAKKYMKQLLFQKNDKIKELVNELETIVAECVGTFEIMVNES